MTKQISHYQLEIVNGHTELRVYGARFDKGFTAIESIPTATPKAATIATLEKHGRATAKRMNVEFINKISE